RNGPFEVLFFREHDEVPIMPRPAPPVLSLVLATLRKSRGWTGADLAAAGGTSAKMISLYETGRRTLRRERLEKLAAVMDFGGEEIDRLLPKLGRTAEVVEEAPASPLDPASDDLRRIRELASDFGTMSAELMERQMLKLLRTRRAARDRQ